jgi:hypothetical protein
VLLLEDACAERLDRVVLANLDSPLQDDRTAVQPFIDEVNGASRFLRVSGDGLRLGIHTRKCGKQRRMNVQNPAPIPCDECGTQQAHVAGERDVVRLRVFEHAQDLAFVRGAIGKVTIVDHVRVAAPFPRFGDSRRIGPIRNHGDDFRVELAFDDGLMDRGEVRAAPGEENRQPDHSIQLAKPAGGVSYTT